MCAIIKKNTLKECHMKPRLQYPELGPLLIDLRSKAGLVQQADLARLVKSTQQTVSRWELEIGRAHV